MTQADTQIVRSGGCLCGAVRFEARSEPKWAAYCHCASCRRHTGAPVSAYAGFEAAAVTFVRGTPALYASSPGVERGFCARCGSTLTFAGARWPGEIHLHLGAFDRPEEIVPGTQVFADERVPWFHLAPA